MDFNLTDEQKLIQETSRKFAKDFLEEKAVERDEKKIWPKEAVKKMSELGLMGIMVSPEYGGSGMDTISYTIAMEEICKVDASVGVIMSVNNSLVCYLIEKFGNKELKKKYLSELASGQKLGAFSLSEPQSGSDASNMRAFASNEGNYYILNGTKNWVTNGISSDYVIVFAVTDKDIGHKGISCFLIDKKWEGVDVGKPEDKLGIRSSDTCELYFSNVKIPKENRIDDKGNGFKIAMSTLDGGRIGIASQALGIAQAALEKSISYSKDRKQFGKPIARNQAIQNKLAEMSTAIESSRLLIRKAAWTKDNGYNFSQIAAQAKVFSSETAVKAATECVQIHGGNGYIREYGVERLMRDAKITQIYEGTSEIQRIVISRSILN